MDAKAPLTIELLLLQCIRCDTEFDGDVYDHTIWLMEIFIPVFWECADRDLISGISFELKSATLNTGCAKQRIVPSAYIFII